MNTPSSRFRPPAALAHALVMAALLVIGAPSVLAQAAPDNSPAITAPIEAAAASSADAPLDETPRRARDRRRGEQAPTAEAAAPAAAAATAAEAATAADAELVCEYKRLPGTNIKRRICGTAEQWESSRRASTEAAQEAMRQVRDRTTIVVTQPGNPLEPAQR